MKRLIYKGLIGATLAVSIVACDSDLLDTLTSSDTSAGLKSALTVGIDSAATKLGKKDGYLADVAVKIGIPSEVATTFATVQKVSSDADVSAILDATGTSIPSEATFDTLFNRAAEDAAPKSVDIFVDAISGMTIDDAENILFGADNAATEYLHNKTYTNLQSAFNPTITSSLNTITVASVTPTKAWSKFAEYNNKISSYVNSTAGKAAIALAAATGNSTAKKASTYASQITEVNTDLADYVTGKALDGLFTKVADKEYDIRYNVNARVNDVLKKVFGRLDTQSSSN